MKKFILRLFLFLSPFLFLIIIFLVLDPFAMFSSPRKYTMDGSMNDDAQTMRTFEQYNPVIKYNAFIFGNSKTLAILSVDWKKQIGENNRIYKFGSPGESILNIKKKLEFAIKSGNKIDHAIILLDNKILKNTDNNNQDFAGPVYLKGPKTSNNNWLEYTGKGFYYYLYDGFFITYFYNVFNNHKTIKSNIKVNLDIIESVMSKEEFKNLHQSNEFYRWDTEQKILYDSATWVQSLPQIEAIVNQSNQTIHTNDLLYLQEIKQLFDNNKTKYKIVFGPEYGCMKMNDSVIQKFNKFFGKSNVYDFSSDENFCKQPINFYEPNHYRPIVGKKMLEIVYQ